MSSDSPIHLTQALADLIRCTACNGSIVQVSGRASYGCCEKNCSNKLLIQRKQIRAVILNDLRGKFLTTGNLKYMHETLQPNRKKLVLALEELAAEKCPIETLAYHVTSTSIHTLALLDEEDKNVNGLKGRKR